MKRSGPGRMPHIMKPGEHDGRRRGARHAEGKQRANPLIEAALLADSGAADTRRCRPSRTSPGAWKPSSPPGRRETTPW
ncbi:MAG: hypothetical protein MZV63_22145 [Marinilabiliales bacterium]|nr:hypothetical protein [Marinilabiliales bacterium]